VCSGDCCPCLCVTVCVYVYVCVCVCVCVAKFRGPTAFLKLNLDPVTDMHYCVFSCVSINVPSLQLPSVSQCALQTLSVTHVQLNRIQWME